MRLFPLPLICGSSALATLEDIEWPSKIMIDRDHIPILSLRLLVSMSALTYKNACRQRHVPRYSVRLEAYCSQPPQSLGGTIIR